MPTPYPAPEIAQLRPGLWIWHAYDPSVKAELFATAFAAGDGIYLVDPIPLPGPEYRQLDNARPIKGVIITNINHGRAACDLAKRFSVPIFAHPTASAEIKAGQAGDLSSLGQNPDLEVIEIEGAVAGEIALYRPVDGGTMIVGDALINFEPYGFTFLPPKYCLDQKQMRRSLRKLLSFSFKRLLFAHGTPILSGAGDRLRELLESDS
ncbi:MAG TPA: hypothetical protein VKS98_10940 [Chthoniobacterales bacterium]|nr:hypothetical protein [Chthoniobacterales bacterium]